MKGYENLCSGKDFKSRNGFLFHLYKIVLYCKVC